jgi:hypothetical protein
MDYWKECILYALDEAGITATDEQVETIAGCVEDAHDNYGMAHGYDSIPCPVESQAKRELEAMKREKEKYEQWVLSTNPCKYCITSGWRKDGWGRDMTCDWCNGKGRC